MSRTRAESLEPNAWKIVAVATLGPFMALMEEGDAPKVNLYQ